MKTWSVFLAPDAEKELIELPRELRKKFDQWTLLVQGYGPWLKGGWRTEALRGRLKGFYSIRLNRQWRVIFEIRVKRDIVVIRIVAHDYKSVGRK
jgi:mRNA-degrading endonuclease RelE of RelBE toxin-antitoxin system